MHLGHSNTSHTNRANTKKGKTSDKPCKGQVVILYIQGMYETIDRAMTAMKPTPL